MPELDAVLEHLENQIAWYDRESLSNQRTSKRFKIVEVVAASLIPFLSALTLKEEWSAYTTAALTGLAVLIITVEGLLHFNQSQTNWIRYRSTCELLKHEKFLYLGQVGPYAGAAAPRSLLAERIEFFVRQEHAKREKNLPLKVRVVRETPELTTHEKPNEPMAFPPGVGPFSRRIAGSGDFRIHVVTPSGDSHPVHAPADMNVGEFITELINGLGLPSVDAERHSVTWIVDDEETGKILDYRSNLAENGVRNGHNLHIRRRVLGPLYSPEVSRIQFSVHYPLSIAPDVWSTLLTYAHLVEALTNIQEETNVRIGKDAAKGYFRAKGVEVRDVSRGAQITVVPQLPGCVVNPEQAKFLWLEDWHCAEFRLKARSNEANTPMAGQISFYVGPILVCEITVVMQFVTNKGRTRREARITTTSDPYQSIFVSYSHDDSQIVAQLEKAYTVLGMQYLRDVRILRSGERWSPTLLAKIEEADMFQLCWSEAAKGSQYVTQEWRHALGLNRQSFVRPMYWQIPMPDPPPELADVHFAFLDLQE